MTGGKNPKSELSKDHENLSFSNLPEVYICMSQYNHCSQLSHILAKISLSAFTPSPSLLQSVVLFICSNNRSTTVTDNCCEQLMRNRDYGTLDKPTDALYPPEML